MEVARWVLVLILCTNVVTLALWLCEILNVARTQADCEDLKQELKAKEEQIKQLNFELDLYKKRENVR